MSKDFLEIANAVMIGVGASTAATANGAIDTIMKDLMVLAIGIAVNCDGCVAYHTNMGVDLRR